MFIHLHKTKLICPFGRAHLWGRDWTTHECLKHFLPNNINILAFLTWGCLYPTYPAVIIFPGWPTSLGAGFVSQSLDRPRGDLGSGKKLDRIVDKKSFLSNHLETKLWCHFTTNDITSFHGTWDGIWEKATKLCTLSLTDNTSVFQELGWNFSVIWARKVLVVSVIWGRKVSPSLSVAVTWHKNQLKQEVPIRRPTWNVTQIYVTFYPTIWNRVQLLKISRSPLSVLVYVFVCVCFHLFWFGDWHLFHGERQWAM